MKKDVWENEQAVILAKVLTQINDLDVMKNFMRDVMTDKEVAELSSRFKAAKMLIQGEKYAKIVEETKLSSRTVARISDWLKNGAGGYRQAVESVQDLK